MTSYGTMHAYYRDQTVLPTHGRFDSAADLDAHALFRAQLFDDKLLLPLRLFEGARLLEFGPDSGENALVFARWGAQCTLVEPNVKAHAVLLEYFQRYGLSHKLADLEEADMATFARREDLRAENDFVIAEGFIYTVQPTQLWIDVIRRLLRPGGHAVVNYCEMFGSWVELLTKVVHAQMRRLTGWPALESAEQVFGAKWNTIPHMRTLESWVVDVLENPFVRLRYFLEPDTLCGEMEAAGLALHASWPTYRNPLDVYWHKRTLPIEEQVRGRREFLARSRLSHMFGTALFLGRASNEARLLEIVRVTDELIDDFSPAGARRLSDGLGELLQLLSHAVVYAAPGHLEAAMAAVQSLDAIVTRLAAGDTRAVLTLCQNDGPFLSIWGMPYHFAVFRARG